MIRAYYRLTKPGIVYSNALAAAAGYAFGAHGTGFELSRLLALIAGVIGVIAAACVLNNVIDRDVDAKMARTKGRALPSGAITVPTALLCAFLLGALGFALLVSFTNLLAASVAAFGVASYVGLYTPAKRITVESTLIGTLPGATPPVIGYAAATGTLDATALCLFLVLVSWQMVHFFAIAVYRVDEYRAANLPIMSVRYGTAMTKALMAVYAFLFGGSLVALAVVHPLPPFSLVVLGALTLGWIALTLSGFRAGDEARWARRAFAYSIAVLLAFCAAIAF